MWGKINNINKWKDMAVGMVAPRSHADAHGSDDDRSDDSDEVHHRRTRRVSSAGGVTPSGGARSELRERTRADEPPPSERSKPDEVVVLRHRVAELERENAGVVAQAQQYSMDVKKNHEETVGFYERKLQASEREWATQIASERATRKELSGQLQTAQNALAELREQVQASAAAAPATEAARRDIPHVPDAANTVVAESGHQHAALLAASQQEACELRAACAAMEMELSTLRSAASQQESAMAAAATAQQQSSSAADDALRQATDRLSAVEAQHQATLSALEATRRKAADREEELQRQCTALAAQLADAQRMGMPPAAPTQPQEAHAAAGDHNARSVVATALQTLQDDVAQALASRESTMNAAIEALRGSAMQQAASWQRKAEALEASVASAAAASQHASSAAREEAAQAVAAKEAAFNTTLKEVMDAKGTLSVALAEAKEQHQTAIRQCERVAAERDAAQTALQDLQQRASAQAAELASLQRSKESERSLKSHEAQTISTLRATVGDLETECQRMRSLHEQLLQTCVDALKQVRCAVPAPTRGGGGVADVLAAVVKELMASHTAVAEAHDVQQQWEKTYAQAKEVNQSVSKQLQESQRLVQELRGEVANRDRSLASLHAKMKEESSRWQDAQVNMSAQHQSAQRFESERLQLREEVASANRAKQDAEALLQNAQNELEAVRNAMQDKDDELSTSQRAASNLQMVLEQFQRGKQREIEEQTLYLNHELEGLRSELAAMESLKQRHGSELELAARSHRKEMASKNVAINSLQAKLTEMKRILEETASQLSDEHMIDKRVVSHLVVNFVHSVALQRGDEEDMLKVMSGLLNWDDTMQQKAGLVPGPLNPRRRAATSLVGGLVRSVWGGARGGDKAVGDGSSTPAGGDNGQPRSIAEMWVEFLMKEGGGGSGEEAHGAGGTKELDVADAR